MFLKSNYCQQLNKLKNKLLVNKGLVKRRVKTFVMVKKFVHMMVIAVVILLSACATTVESEMSLHIEEHEAIAGKEIYQKVLENERIYSDRELQLYVELIGKNIAAHSLRPDIEYEFFVLDNNDMNAFALPDGKIFITKNMLLHLNKESHLAAILAHEIAHVSAKHFSRTRSKKSNLRKAALPLKVLGYALAPYGGAYLGVLATDLINKGLASHIIGYSRDFEIEADALGAQYLAKAGYAPEDMIEVLSLLKSRERYISAQVSNEFSQALGLEQGIHYHASQTSSHPSTDQRLQEVIQAAENYLQGSDVQADRRDYLMMLDGVSIKSEQFHTMDASSSLVKINDEFLTYLPNAFHTFKESSLIKAKANDKRVLLLPTASEETDLIALDVRVEMVAEYNARGSFKGFGDKVHDSIILFKTLANHAPKGLGQKVSAKQFLLDYIKTNSINVLSSSGEKIKTPYGEAYFMRSKAVRNYQQYGFVGKKYPIEAESMYGVVFIGDTAVIVETYRQAQSLQRMPHERILKSVLRNIRSINAKRGLYDVVPLYNYSVGLKIVEPGETLASIANDLMLQDAETQLRLLNDYYPDGEPEFGQTIKTFVDPKHVSIKYE